MSTTLALIVGLILLSIPTKSIITGMRRLGFEVFICPTCGDRTYDAWEVANGYCDRCHRSHK